MGIFRELEIKFNPKMSIIAGPNGVGKTSILRILGYCTCFNGIVETRFGNDSELWLHYEQYRLGVGSGFITSPAYRQVAQFGNALPPQEPGLNVAFPNNLEQAIPDFAPLFIGAYRRINYASIQGMSKEASIAEQRIRYRYEAIQRLNGTILPDVKQWLINRYYQIDKDWAKVERLNWDWLLQKINILSPPGSDLSFVRIGRDLEPVFKLNGQECYLEELSAGFQSILSVVFTIFNWVEGINEQSQAFVPDAKGTVIIDELDAHLHPEWQLTILDSLKIVFPNIQFIITTHSPHIIAAAGSGEIIRLPKHDGVLKVEPTSKTYSGWNTDQILEGVMEVRNLENKRYDELVQAANNSILSENLPSLNDIFNKLKEIAHPDDTILQVLTMKSAALELKSGENK